MPIPYHTGRVFYGRISLAGAVIRRGIELRHDQAPLLEQPLNKGNTGKVFSILTMQSSSIVVSVAFQLQTVARWIFVAHFDSSCFLSTTAMLLILQMLALGSESSFAFITNVNQVQRLRRVRTLGIILNFTYLAVFARRNPE
jgi:hypothetical protein